MSRSAAHLAGLVATWAAVGAVAMLVDGASAGGFSLSGLWQSLLIGGFVAVVISGPAAAVGLWAGRGRAGPTWRAGMLSGLAICLALVGFTLLPGSHLAVGGGGVLAALLAVALHMGVATRLASGRAGAAAN